MYFPFCSSAPSVQVTNPSRRLKYGGQGKMHFVPRPTVCVFVGRIRSLLGSSSWPPLLRNICHGQVFRFHRLQEAGLTRNRHKLIQMHGQHQGCHCLVVAVRGQNQLSGPRNGEQQAEFARARRAQTTRIFVLVSRIFIVSE